MLSASRAPICADALLAPLATEPSLLLAVSGGPDSVALMLLAARWSLRERRAIAVATVDHGLREGSRAEAEDVAGWAAAAGFAHHLLAWEGEKPTTRLQERARAARYALLSDCARRIGASAIVTAHHADDQAETILFRLSRGSGVAGLAGMAARTSLDGLALLRPLLGIRKTELAALCAESGHPFHHDPSNENESFARTKLRKLGATLTAQGLDSEALLRLGRRAAQAEEALAWSAARMDAEAVASRDETQTRFEPAILCGLPHEILQRLIAAEVARVAGPARLRLDRIERAAALVAEALASHASARITLGGAAIVLDRRNLTVRRAPPRRAAPRAVDESGEIS